MRPACNLPHGPCRPAGPPTDTGVVVLALPRGPGRELRITTHPARARRSPPRGEDDHDADCTDADRSAEGATGDHPEIVVRLREWVVLAGEPGEAGRFWPLPGRSAWIGIDEIGPVIAALATVAGNRGGAAAGAGHPAGGG